jgi:hypothetical protein
MLKTIPKDIQGQRNKVAEFEGMLSSMPGAVHGDSAEFPLNHMFGGGLYCREILLPAGSTCIGKIHKTTHPNFILKGRCIVTTNVCDKPVEIIAPMYFYSEAGVKKVVHAIEDTIWVTVHQTDETDLEIIEDQIIAKDYNELAANTNKEILPCHG